MMEMGEKRSHKHNSSQNQNLAKSRFIHLLRRFVVWGHPDHSDRYNALLGTFTVPPGGAGLYYFSTYLLLNAGEYADFDLRTDDQLICIAWGDHDNSGAFDNSQATCSGLVQLPEGAILCCNYGF